MREDLRICKGDLDSERKQVSNARGKRNAAGDSANCLNISKYGVPGTSLCAAVVD